MKTQQWARACLIASIAIAGAAFFSLNPVSHAEDGKAAAKAPDLEPEAGYGTLKGQFVLDGDIPTLAPVGTPAGANGGDIKTCGGTEVPSEALVVDKKSKGIKNIFVYIQKAPAKVHPSLKKSAEPEVVFDQKVCQFIPRYLLVRTDQKVRVISSDPVPHNTHTHPIRNVETNNAIAPNEKKGIELKFNLAEKLPISVGCDIHRWMNSYWLILDHPYAAVTDADGKFAIGKIPAGDYEFIVWQESAGYVIPKPYKVKIESNKVEDKGVIKVPVSKFKL